jgi:glycosyltransferase involved in cell wall biosynthesis
MTLKIPASKSNYVLHLSSYPHRECGIATFTQDLTLAIDNKFNPAIKSRIIALNDQSTSIYNYNNRVFGEITATEIENYVNLAREINTRSDVKIVNIQHEFGLFGGSWGDYLIPFLQVIEKPVVVTFHSVLSGPEEELRNIVRSIAEKSAALVVMNKLSETILLKEYGIPKEKVVMIPHGIPQASFEPSDKFKLEHGFEGKIVLSTFGLLSPNKGIQYAIRALPEVVKKYPNVIYLVLGATHPNIRKEKGEIYRNALNVEVEKLGLKDHVKFYNKYLTIEEIISYLKATDIYISPTVDPDQSVSGTLSYAMGCGRPIVSTATAYAKYLVTAKNGILVNFRSANSISDAILKLLDDPKKMKSLSSEAYEVTRPMTWPNVATSYFKLYENLVDLEREERKLPEINLSHLTRMTDNFGIFHFAKYSKPEKRYGYSLDDNARALVVCAKYFKLNPKPEIENLLNIFLKFIKFTQRPSGTFANIVSYQKQKDATTDEDVQGRAIWALGYAASQTLLPEKVRLEAERMLKKALPHALKIISPRAVAFTLSGLYFYLKQNPDKKLTGEFIKLADHQLNHYKNVASEDWHWFEDQLTYSNSKLPESLIYAYDLIGDKKYLEVAKKTVNFLDQITFEKDYYSPIGQNGWYFRQKKRSYFDQQPEDTASTVETKVTAYKVTKDKKHLKDAYTAFQWFLGKNHLGQMVYDEVTGGCCDGVGQYAINLNQGAESTISYLMARLAIEEIKEN